MSIKHSGRWSRITRVLIFSLLITLSGAASAAAINHVLGWVETVAISPWEVQVKAKLDTGALTSSLHATEIERFERDGEKWVRFIVNVEDQRHEEMAERMFERPLFRNVILRGAGGTDRRPVVLMDICVGSKIYEEQFSLEDRSDMIYPMLLGRRTIQHLGVVDVTRTFLTEPRCDADSKRFTEAGQSQDADIGD